MTDLRYPIGRVDFSGRLDPNQRAYAIEEVRRAPALVREAVAGLNDQQLDTPYRPEGWTVRQVVHHLPDSHSNAFTRMKLALTEDNPTIRTYDETRWAELPDAAGPIDMALGMLDAVHERWVYLMTKLPENAWERQLFHPELGQMRVDELLAFYAWHGRHHAAHITSLRDREGW